MSHELDENSKKIIIEEAEEQITTAELCDEAMDLIVQLLPPKEYGEDDECERLYNIIQVIKYRNREQP